MSMRRVRVRVRLTLSFLNCGSALFSLFSSRQPWGTHSIILCYYDDDRDDGDDCEDGGVGGDGGDGTTV